jgi:hypothetical protein
LPFASGIVENQPKILANSATSRLAFHLLNLRPQQQLNPTSRSSFIFELERVYGIAAGTLYVGPLGQPLSRKHSMQLL